MMCYYLHDDVKYEVKFSFIVLVFWKTSSHTLFLPCLESKMHVLHKAVVQTAGQDTASDESIRLLI